MENQTAEIELLIETHKEEGKEYGLSGRTLIFWIIFRIIDYFYKLTINGYANRTIKDYCELLAQSSLMKKSNYNTFRDLINDFENHSINISYDIESIINENKNINTNLNIHGIIDILKNCPKITKYAGGRKSRNNISKINKLSRNGGKKARMINIKIKTIDNIVEYNATFSKNDYVLSIKNNILDELDIKIENQRITFLGNELTDYQTLSQSGLMNGSTLIVEDTFVYTNLCIKLSLLVDTDKPGNYFIICVSPNSTILDLKKRAADLFKINLPDIELSDGKFINYNDDEQILSELGLITNKSIVYVDDNS
jgi:hypothetical protein